MIGIVSTREAKARLDIALAETRAIAAATTAKIIQLYADRHLIASLSQSRAASATGSLAAGATRFLVNRID